MRKMVNITQQLIWTDDKTDDDERDAKTGDETDYKQPDTTEICLT